MASNGVGSNAGELVRPSPFTRGPYQVATFAAPGIKSFTMRVWYPHAQSQSKQRLPLLIFVGGFLQPENQYANLLSTIASHGIMAVGVGWKLTTPLGLNYTGLADNLGSALAYASGEQIKEDLEKMAYPPLSLPRNDSILLGGHSIGNHVTVRRLTSFGCDNIGGVVLIDPVDGADPYGVIKQYVIHPPAPVSFMAPALHIMTGLDPRRKSWLYPPCAPAPMSNGRFYRAWRGPIWQWNATEFGHNDVTDSAWKGVLAPCPGNGDVNALAQYQLTAAGAVAAFTRALYVREPAAESGAILDGMVRTPVHVEYARRAGASAGRLKPFCLPAVSPIEP